MEELTALPTPVLIALGILVVVQLSLEIYAIIDIIKRPADRITGGNKALWIVLVVFVNLVGAIVYLAVGRQAAPAADDGAAPASGDAAARAVDTLYGTKGQQ